MALDNQTAVEEKTGAASAPASAPAFTSLIPSRAEVDAELRNGTLIAKRVTATTAALTSVKDQVKASSSLLRYGIESLEKVATPLTKKVMSKVDSVVVKNLDKLSSSAYNTALSVGGKLFEAADENKDGKLSAREVVSAPLNIFKGLVVNAEWFNAVDKIINPAGVTPETLLSRFNEAASAEFRRLFAAAKAARGNSEEFVKGLSAEMRDAWDTRLKAPALAFYAAAKAEYKSAGSIAEALAALEPVWERQVVSVFRARLRPAVIVYKSTMRMYNTYRKLAEKEGLQVSAEAFLAQVRTHLQDAYDERLAPLITEFYEGASKLLSRDLERIVKALDTDGERKLTLGDFWHMGNELVGRLVSRPYQNLYQAVLRTTLTVVDRVAPQATPEAKEGEGSEAMDTKAVVKDLTLSLVTKTISKRLVTKAFDGFRNLKVRTTALVGPDLIAYADSLLADANTAMETLQTRATTTAQAAHASVSTTVATIRDHDLVKPALAKLETSLDALKTFVGDNITKPLASTTAKLMASPRAAELKRRFAVAMARARSVTQTSTTYLAKRELLLLPTDLGEFLAMSLGLRRKDGAFSTVVAMASGLFAAMFDVVKVLSWTQPTAQDNKLVEVEVDEKSSLLA